MAEARPLDLGDPGVRRAWAALLDASPYASPFSALDYAEATEAFGLRPVAVGVEQDGALVGAAVAYEKRRGPYRLAVVPPLTPVTPVLLAEEPPAHEVHAHRSALDALIAGVEGRFHALAFRLPHALADVRPFTWAGYRAAPVYTYAGRLGAADELLQASSRSVRRTVQRAAGDFVLTEEPDRLDVLGSLEAEAYDRQGTVSPLAPEPRDAFLQRLLDAGMARLFVLRTSEGGDAVAARVVVSDGTSAAFLIAGSRRGPALTVMTYRLWDQLSREGVERLDLVGANLPAVAEFKRSFGLPLVHQFRVWRIRRPELRALALVRPVV